MTEPVRIVCDRLSASQVDIVHGFFTRRGGASTGIYQSLNVGLGSADDYDTVKANRAKVTKSLGLAGAFLATPHQIHSPDAIFVDEPWSALNRPQADGVVTRTPGLVLGVLTADCGPVLFADNQGRVVGACHAGWRGALTGVIENTISQMEQIGAHRARIKAVLGPSISQENYEVGPEFVDRFIMADPQNSRFFLDSANTGHSLFDLPGYILARLSLAGVESEWTGHCTYADEMNFFSYRRTTHRDEPDYGRQVSAIAIRN